MVAVGQSLVVEEETDISQAHYLRASLGAFHGVVFLHKNETGKKTACDQEVAKSHFQAHAVKVSFPLVSAN
jgi:hypothetical protein